ncbi:MAG: C40 family peptidase [Bacteroidia bacterium]|nr:C40 family peptidase [Bacteroidia bacterium]
MYVVSTLSIVPVRKEPRSQSELVSQWLFGETAEILESGKEWHRIRITHDRYEGWINSAQATSLSHSQFLDISTHPVCLCSGITGMVKDRKLTQEYPVTAGCLLPGLIAGSFLLGENIYSFQGDFHQPEKPDLSEFLPYAMKFIHAPYLWGGRTPFGVDCSGFVQSVYRYCGIPLPRDARQQAEFGEVLSFLEESKAGDLAFFDNKDGEIIHVGILLSPDRILHASGKVRIDKIDHQGIFQEELGNYTHHLRVLKRY